MTPPKAACCVGCGAPAPAVLFPTPYTCNFCHRQQILQPPAPPPPPPVAPPPPMGGPPMAWRPAAPQPGTRRLVAVVPMIIMGVVGLAIAISVSRSGGIGGPSRGGSGPGAGGVVPPGERLQWSSSSRGSVVVADINGDGVEDFVGRYKLLDLKGGQSTQTEYVGAFDGKTFRRIWASPSLGTIQQASNAIAFGVAGDRVVVTDYRAQAHILDLRTGKVGRVFALSDRASAICSAVERRNEVWIEVSDNKNVVFNLETGAATPGPRPAWCAPREATSCGRHAFHGDPCGPSPEERAALYKAGVSASVVLRDVRQSLPRDGARAFAVGSKSPGTPVRMLVAFDPQTMAVAWQTSVAPDPANAGSTSSEPATLANGRIYLTYKTTTPAALHVVAFDASNGQRALDFKVPRGNEGSEAGDIIVSAQRIYVPHWTWLDVFDAKNGRHIETVGMW